MVVLGADHNGFLLKEQLKAFLQRAGETVVDCGPDRRVATDDYVDVAAKVARIVTRRPRARGLLLCGTGNGMVMAANRFRAVRAALAPSVSYATKARQDEDANILVLPAWHVGLPAARRILRAFLSTRPSSAARHVRRRRKLTRLPHA